MYYNPTEEEKKICITIVKELLKTEDDVECLKCVDIVFETAYSIGGDYSEKTLRSIAGALLL